MSLKWDDNVFSKYNIAPAGVFTVGKNGLINSTQLLKTPVNTPIGIMPGMTCKHYCLRKFGPDGYRDIMLLGVFFPSVFVFLQNHYGFGKEALKEIFDRRQFLRNSSKEVRRVKQIEISTDRAMV